MTDLAALLQVESSPVGELSTLVGSQDRSNVTDLSPGEHYYDTVLKFCSRPGVSRVMEIGGGRSPLLPKERVLKLGATYVVNDISESELERCPDYVEKVCFDISGEAPPEQFDFIFSKMVFEHIHDTRRAYENVFELLRPGGICLNYHPTLYSPPFVINSVLPEFVSSLILRTFRPNRNPNGVPKFPANYSWCRATRRQEKKLRGIGFRRVSVLPFYGHGYFRKIPILDRLDRELSNFARRRDIRLLASFAFTLVGK